MPELPQLTDQEIETYQWQMLVPDFGPEQQRRLKGSSVLLSRCGGVGSAMAYYLAAAGVGRLVIAHRGNLQRSDLNRQILMTEDWLGKPRVQIAAQRLRQFNPRMEVVAAEENISEQNAGELVGMVDAVADCAPLFQERLAMNQAAVSLGKPLIEAAMYELQAQVTAIVPGVSPCLACLHPQVPPEWERKFPVFGAVAGMVGAWGAMEVIKVLSGIGEPLVGRMLIFDLRSARCREVKLARDPQCRVCGKLAGTKETP